MRLLVFSILLAFCFSTGARLWVCVNYLVNQKYYAEVLCKNKSVKNSCCKGKCALEKELADLEKKDDPGQAPQLKLAKAEEALCTSVRLNVLRDAGNRIPVPGVHFVYSTGYRPGLLRPPAV